MTDAITTDSSSRSERTRLVMEAHPELIEAMERAGEEYYRNDAIWQAECARQQRAAGLPERRLESPYGKALKEASQAIVARYEELLAVKQEEDRSS